MSISYAHPSVTRFKAPRPYVTVSHFGYITVYNVGSFAPKYSLAPNGSIAGKDIRLNNFSQATESTSNFYISNTPTIDTTNEYSTPISQGNDSNCSLIPLLHKIQSQLDFPMDFQKFLSCVPNDQIPNDMPWLAKSAFRNVIQEFFDDPGLAGDFWQANRNIKLAALRLINILYSGKCIPVSERLRVERCPEGYVLPPSSPEDECDQKCATQGIRIEVIDPGINPKTLADYPDILSKYGPQTIGIKGDNFVRLWLMAQAQTDLSWSQVSKLDSADLREMLGDQWYNEVSSQSHALTLVRSSGPDANGEYSFTFWNSWSGGEPNEFTITWKSDEDFELEDNSGPGLQWTQMFDRLQFKVVPCNIGNSTRPRMTSEEQQNECNQEKCTELGYDKTSSDSDSVCPCECEELVNNRGVKLQKLYTKVSGWKFSCNCKTYSSEQICGGSFNPKQEYIDGCDCKCKNPYSSLPCSGFTDSYDSQSLSTNYNIVPVLALRLL